MLRIVLAVNKRSLYVSPKHGHVCHTFHCMHTVSRSTAARGTRRQASVRTADSRMRSVKGNSAVSRCLSNVTLEPCVPACIQHLCNMAFSHFMTVRVRDWIRSRMPYGTPLETSIQEFLPILRNGANEKPFSLLRPKGHGARVNTAACSGLYTEPSPSVSYAVEFNEVTPRVKVQRHIGDLIISRYTWWPAALEDLATLVFFSLSVTGGIAKGVIRRYCRLKPSSPNPKKNETVSLCYMQGVSQENALRCWAAA